MDRSYLRSGLFDSIESIYKRKVGMYVKESVAVESEKEERA